MLDLVIRARRSMLNSFMWTLRLQQLLLRRWRAELSCAVMLGDVEVYMASLNTEFVPCTVRDGDPPHLYELQRAAFPHQ